MVLFHGVGFFFFFVLALFGFLVGFFCLAFFLGGVGGGGKGVYRIYTEISKLSSQHLPIVTQHYYNIFRANNVE